MRKPKNYTDGPIGIYLRITVDGIPKELSLKRSWEPDRWNYDAGKALGTKEDARQLNHYLDTILLKAQEARRTLIEAHKVITAQAIKNLLSGDTEDRRGIIYVFNEHNDRMSDLVGKEFSPRTLQRYKTTLSHTSAFIKWKFRESDMDILDLNYEFIHDFAFWLKTEQKCSHNSAMKYLSNLKKIVLHCVRTKWLQRDPFAEFKLSKREVIKEILTDAELEAIAIKVLHSERLNLVRDIFLFSCYTGLAYADIKNLNKPDVKQGMDKQQWIFINRQKTETLSRIPLLPLPLKLIEKYADHPKCCVSGMVFPTLSNQKMNAYLKEIADMCDIDKNLTFHSARHTFATTIALNNGLPLETVADILGHKSLKQAQHYAKLSDARISKDMANLRAKMSNEQATAVEKQTMVQPDTGKPLPNPSVKYNYIIKS